ncbi:unnamed protein product [Rhizoctonia solani]|uniref:Uncharacterized protein n=1 Tax=Rhizoctonia solani TaxID=456999 RepID=A0A8H3AV42_9AGAM|nr:unnamed protein product [Rhizoctonia solani]
MTTDAEPKPQRDMSPLVTPSEEKPPQDLDPGPEQPGKSKEKKKKWDLNGCNCKCIAGMPVIVAVQLYSV